MKLNFKNIAFGLMLTGGFVGNAMAIGTEAGTVVENSATLTYLAGTDSRSIDSAPTGGVAGDPTVFTVDRKLDVEVTGDDVESVFPGDTDKVVQFTVTNKGNADQGVRLSVVDITPDDDFDATSLEICVDNQTLGTQGVYDAGVDDCTNNAIANLGHSALGDDIIVFVVGDIPATVIDGNRDDFYLIAEVEETALTAALVTDSINGDDSATDKNSNLSTVLDVFADGDGDGTGDADKDGKHSAKGTYLVEAAAISVTKVASLVWDPVNCTEAAPVDSSVAAACSGNPKAIPGAYVLYTITVVNTGSAQATGAAVSDNLDSDVDGDNIFDTQYVDNSSRLENEGGTTVTGTEDHTVDGDNTTADVVSYTGFTIDKDTDPNDQVVLTFFAEIQ